MNWYTERSARNEIKMSQYIAGTFTPVPNDRQAIETVISGFYTATALYAPTVTVSPTPEILYTAGPTNTTVPTATPTEGPLSLLYTFTFGYSYYYPPLGPPNCSDENWDGVRCLDSTSSGRPWSNAIGAGVAIPIEYSTLIPRDSTVSWCVLYHKPCIPFFALVRVSDGPMRGDWVVIDTCGSCIKNNIVYLDFLDDRQKMDWSLPVEVEIWIP